MANTSARMLRLLSLLQTHRFWPGSELAGRLEVSERTLRRDVDRLRDLGYPVDAARGVAGGYQLRSGAAMPPLLLDDEEAVAIAVGLHSAAGGVVDGIEETSVRALTKVIQVMPPRLRRRVDALQNFTVAGALGAGGPKVDAAALTTIAQACRDDERLRFDYTDRDGQRTSRLVEPHRMVSLGRRWYLVAWDAERHDWRTFRVDRLLDPRSTGHRFRQRELPGGDAAEYVRQRLAAQPTRYRVVARLAAPADELEPQVRGTGTILEPVDERSCRFVMNVDEFHWPMFVLGAVGVDFEIEQPDEFADYLRGAAALFLRAGS
ncbi:helix-turn-helix transcriptional regulator [Amycolatopsis suaedae]|uniref:YafY family transcriptional regulator n=1 Tax=Amycolatopsis suaedae TaxID=2510978 RepID=A0A4Q7JFN7_9PSEU|nr:YafY family protein [Amycolatopsis suaedae]RZQ66076.1 YafY family transcriptional regulator [Amycolatopsis suaedae]